MLKTAMAKQQNEGIDFGKTDRKEVKEALVSAPWHQKSLFEFHIT